MSPELVELKEQLAALIVDTAGSLHTQMQQGFERVEARLGRHGGLIQGGSKALARLIEWSERMDEIVRVRDREIADLRSRVQKLEQERENHS